MVKAARVIAAETASRTALGEPVRRARRCTPRVYQRLAHTEGRRAGLPAKPNPRSGRAVSRDPPVGAGRRGKRSAGARAWLCCQRSGAPERAVWLCCCPGDAVPSRSDPDLFALLRRRLLLALGLGRRLAAD